MAPACHGWDGNYQAVWDKNPFPEDLSELLIEEEKDGDDDAELEFMSDDNDYDDFDKDTGSDSGDLMELMEICSCNYHNCYVKLKKLR